MLLAACGGGGDSGPQAITLDFAAKAGTQVAKCGTMLTGLGSGAVSAIAARNALGHKARVVGVISRHATTYADSLAAGRVVEAAATTRWADGMAVRRADAGALTVLADGLDHLVQVSDEEVAAAVRALYADTHNLAEGAGAAAFAAAWQERADLRGQCVGVALTGANVDAGMLVEMLQ